LENEKSYFQGEFRNFKNSESGEAGKNRMRNLILCDLKTNGPDSSFEAKVTAVLSLDSESGFLVRCWKGGGFGFVDRVGFRDRICFVDMVGFRDRICFVDRVGFRDMICFVDRVGFRYRICFVDRVGFVGWKWMDKIKLNQNKSKPATKLNLEHELRTADSKTKLCKG
jgi:hypothetical protein